MKHEFAEDLGVQAALIHRAQDLINNTDSKIAEVEQAVFLAAAELTAVRLSITEAPAVIVECHKRIRQIKKEQELVVSKPKLDKIKRMADTIAKLKEQIAKMEG